MKLNVTHEKFGQAHLLERPWAKVAPPGEPALGLRERLRAHAAALGAESFRKGAAVAALLAVELTLQANEEISTEDEVNLLEAVKSWAAAWGGSGPVAARSRWTKPSRPSSRSRSSARRRGRTDQPEARVLLLELIVAPVRPEVRGGRETRRVVSLNKALGELAVATLGPGTEARHAEALEASCRAHLARALPGLSVTPRRAPEPEPEEPEVIRLRREQLERDQAALDKLRAELELFPVHAEEVLTAIESKVIFLDQDGNLGGAKDFRLSDQGREHFRQHRSTYTMVLKNPSLHPGMRVMLEMVLGHLAKEANPAANDDAYPRRAEGER